LARLPQLCIEHQRPLAGAAVVEEQASRIRELAQRWTDAVEPRPGQAGRRRPQDRRQQGESQVCPKRMSRQSRH
jgi:hypothetical protein